MGRLFLKQKKSPLLVVNIDEGEPEIFKDKYYLETEPLHFFLEGMMMIELGDKIKT